MAKTTRSGSSRRTRSAGAARASTTSPTLPTPWGERLQRAIIISFHLMVFTVPFAFTWFNDELFELNKMVLVYGFTVLIGGLWLLRVIAERRFIWRWHWSLLPVVVFLLTQAVSTILSIHPHTSLFGYYSRFNGSLLSSLSYSLIMAAVVSNFNRRHLKPLLVTSLLAGIGTALFAIPEHFGVALSCAVIGNSSSPGLSLSHFSTDCWSEATNPRFRIFGTFGQPNWLAAYLVTLLPVGVSLTTSHWHSWLSKQGVSWASRVRSWLTSWPTTQVMAVAAVLSMTIALLFTKSRSGVLGLVVALVVWAGLVAMTYWGGVVLPKGGQKREGQKEQQEQPEQEKRARREKKQKRRLSHIQWRTFVAAITPVILTITSIVLVLGSPFTRSLPWLIGSAVSGTPPAEEVQPIPQPVNRLEVGGTDSGEIRKIVWAGALDVWRRYPLFGSGVETFAYSYYQDRPPAHNLVSEWDFLYNKAHNEVLNFMATTGTVGTVAYLAMLAGFGWLGLRLIAGRTRSELSLTDRWLVAALLAGLAGLSVTNFFGFSTVTVNLLMFIYFGMLTVWALGDHSINAGLTASPPGGPASPQDESTSPPGGSAAPPGLESSVRGRAKTGPAQFKSKKQTVGGSWRQVVLGLVVVLMMLIAWQRVLDFWNADRLYAQAKGLLRIGVVDGALTSFAAAIDRSPQEAVYYDRLASALSQFAQTLAEQEEATAAAEVAEFAVTNSNTALELNPAHLNLYKSRANVFLNLAAVDSEFAGVAVSTLQTARELAPTDPSLPFSLGMAYLRQGELDLGIVALETAVELKPDYEAARMQLGQAYERRASQGEDGDQAQSDEGQSGDDLTGTRQEQDLDQSDRAKALEQYRYVLDHITPGHPLAEERVAALSGMIGG